MLTLLIGCGALLLLCVASSKLLYRFGVPTLLVFLALGMLFGSDGPGGLAFDNYELARQICSIGLIFIMFYGGFGTNWKAARPVAAPAIWLSTAGVVITAALTGLFCVWALKTTLLEGLLTGAVLASTDAASVFAVLRSRKLNLKGGLASLLEVESGSNDPVAYMLTLVLLTLMNGEGGLSLGWVLVRQVGFGLLFGGVLAAGSALVLRRVNLEIDGLYPIFVLAVALLGYALCEQAGGNGYLSVYIIGIVLGNSRILHKRSLVHFFDGISWLMQILLFFTLGLLSFPTHLPHVLLPGVLIALFMVFVARPAAVFSILSWFRIPVRQQLLVSWVGLRGAASIVFAIYAVTAGGLLENDIFHVVFFVALFSVAVQGSLIPLVARRLDLVEPEGSVFKTFTDYEDETMSRLVEVTVDETHLWADRSLMDAELPDDALVVMIRRRDQVLVPKGSTTICPGDVLVVSAVDPEKLPLNGEEGAGK